MKGKSFFTLRALVPALALAASDTARVEAATGLKGVFNSAEGVFKVSAPRNDVTISVDGWQMPPFMGLTSWAAFKDGTKAETMVMGDLVLFQDEVNPVMSAAFDAGLNVPALHNHFFYEESRILFLHYWGRGRAADLASSLKRTFAVQKAVP